jgi:predicted GNAT family N-acyltransferase
MIPGDFYLEPGNWPADRDALYGVREEVFVVGQMVPRELEQDSLDASATHVLAKDWHGNAIGTGRLLADGKIGRMAVLRHWRRRAVGQAMLVHLLDQARQQGLAEVYLQAQIDAVPFYLKNGFSSEGEQFLDAGILHVTMRRKIVTEHATTIRPVRPAQRIEHYATSVQLRDLTIRLINNASSRLLIWSRDLDPLVYADSACLDALRALALKSPHGQIKIMVCEPARIAQRGHRLLELARRMTSVFMFRQPGTQDLQYPSAYLTNDTFGYAYRPSSERFDGEGGLHTHGRFEELGHHFEGAWERAVPADELRRLSL